MNIRFVEIIISREGGGGSTCPLYFDGAVDYFKELPLPTDSMKLAQAYAMLDIIRNKKNVLNHLFNKNFKRKLTLWEKLWGSLVCLVKENLPAL